MARKKDPRDEPRPVCPECEDVLDPETCVVALTRPGSYRFNVLVAGLYCSPDCLLYAFRRGFARSRGNFGR